MIHGTLLSVSTLLTTVGQPKAPCDGGKRRTVAWIGALALQRFQQPGLLAADICAGSAMRVDLDAEARAHHVRTDVAFGARLGQRRVENFLLQRELAAQIDVTGVRADRAAGDQNPLDYPVRVIFELVAVGKRPRLALIGVAADIDRLLRVAWE